MSGADSPGDSTAALGARSTEGAAEEADAHAPAGGRARGLVSGIVGWVSRLWARFAGEVMVAVSAVVLLVPGFGLSVRRIAAPLGDGDLLPAYVSARVWADGAPFGNASFGFPFGMEWRYFPTTDVLTNGLAGLVGAVTGNPYVGLNLVYVLSFPVTALVAYWVLGIAGLRGPVAGVMALAFTFIPFHWFRLEHIYLATMYSAALGVGLALLIGKGEVERRLRSPRRWRSVAHLSVIALVVATSGIYYTVFTLILCAAALVFRFARGSGWRGLIHGAVPAIGVAVFTGLVLAPSWVYVHMHPAFADITTRGPVESIMYGGSLSFAILPAPVSQVPGMGRVNASANSALEVAHSAGVNGELGWSNFGSLSTVLALALFFIGGVFAYRRSLKRPGEAPSGGSGDADASPVTQGLVVTLLGTGLLFFTTLGLNFLVAWIVTPQIRAWNRMIPLLFLLVFVGAAVVWRSLGLPTRGVRALSVCGVCVVIMVFDSILPYRSFFDSMASAGVAEGGEADEYAAALNAAVPGRCGVLQLPYLGFPEVPPLVDLYQYAPLSVSLANPDKLWTYGAMKSTSADAWMVALGNTLDQDDADALASAGLCAVHVDLRGFTPEGDREVTKMLNDLLGRPVAMGHSGDWLAFKLPAVDADKVVDVTDFSSLPDDLQVFFSPPTITAAPDANVTAEGDEFHYWWWVEQAPVSFGISATDPEAEFSELTGELLAAECASQKVTVELVSGGQRVSDTFELNPAQTQDFTVRLPEASTEATLTVSSEGRGCVVATDARSRTVALVDLKVSG